MFRGVGFRGFESFLGLRVWDLGVESLSRVSRCLMSSQQVLQGLSGLLSNQGEKSINSYFIMVPLRKKY